MRKTLGLLAILVWAGVPLLAHETDERGSPRLVLENGPPPKTLEVDCSHGDTLATALEQHQDRVLVLEISGSCVENVVLGRNDVTLRAAQPGAEIVGTLTLLGATGVVLDGLTFRGSAAQGISIQRASEVTALGVTVRNQPREGIVLTDNSTLVGRNLTLEQNGSHGIRVRGSSHLDLAQTVNARFNGGAGLLIDLGSSLLGLNLTLDASNNNVGLAVQGSSAQLQGCQLTASNNSFTGVLIRDGSQIFFGTCQIAIRNNAFSGLTLAMSSILSNFAGAPSTAVVENNPNFGVFVNTASYLNTIGGLNLTVTNNTAIGINTDNANVELRGVTATGNGAGGDLVLTYGSRARSAPGTTLGRVVCDGTQTIVGLARSP